jgi:hypothetical protein
VTGKRKDPLCGPAEQAITRAARHLGVPPVELARWLNTDHTLENTLEGLARASSLDNLSSDQRSQFQRTARSFAEFLYRESERGMERARARIDSKRTDGH